MRAQERVRRERAAGAAKVTQARRIRTTIWALCSRMSVRLSVCVFRMALISRAEGPVGSFYISSEHNC